jgi:hypothetical protein
VPTPIGTFAIGAEVANHKVMLTIWRNVIRAIDIGLAELPSLRQPAPAGS